MIENGEGERAKITARDKVYHFKVVKYAEESSFNGRSFYWIKYTITTIPLTEQVVNNHRISYLCTHKTAYIPHTIAIMNK